MLLETARRAMMAQQIGITTTGHNIANASTAGYSRQRVTLRASPSEQRTYGYLGTGVMIDAVNRVRDRFVDQQMRTTNATLGDANAQQSTLSQIEATFNEPSNAGLSAGLSGFFNAFQELSLHPEDPAARNAVLQQGTLVTQTFHRLHDEMNTTRQTMVEEVTDKVKHINQLASQISDLDVQITRASAGGLSSPNDLLDERDRKIDELSTIAGITVAEDPQGSVIVSMGGVTIASRAGAQSLHVENTAQGVQIRTDKENITVPASGGELGASLTLVNTTIPGYLGKLDELAGALITRVNAVHRSGYGLGTPAPTGLDFFSGTAAADINLSAAIAGNPSAVAASQSGAPGDNKGALALAGIAGEALLGGNSLTLSQFYNGLVTGVGSAVNGAQSTADTQQLILNQLSNQQQSVSGVSIDEEMTNLIQYQRAFDAAARLVNTTNDMFTTILSMLPQS